MDHSIASLLVPLNRVSVPKIVLDSGHCGIRFGRKGRSDQRFHGVSGEVALHLFSEIRKNKRHLIQAEGEIRLGNDRGPLKWMTGDSSCAAEFFNCGLLLPFLKSKFTIKIDTVYSLRWSEIFEELREALVGIDHLRCGGRPLTL